jgi:hypothetical protein
VRGEEGGGVVTLSEAKGPNAQIRVPAPSGRPAGSLQGDIMLLLAPHFSLLNSHSLLLTPYFSPLTGQVSANCSQ